MTSGCPSPASEASRRVCAFLGWFASLARGRMPNGLRDLGAYGIGYARAGLRVRAPPHRPLSELRPERARPGLEPAAAPCAARARRRRPPLAADGRIPAAARAPAPRLAGALERRGDPGGDRKLVRRPRERPLCRAAAPLPRRVRPLLRPRVGVPVPRGQPVPGLRRHARLSRRRRDSRRPSGRAGGSRSSGPSSRCRRSSSPAHWPAPSSPSASSAGSPHSPRGGCRRACATSARCRSATRRRRTCTGSSSTTAIRTRARRCGPAEPAEPEAIA